jgi:hypothetical protein
MIRLINSGGLPMNVFVLVLVCAASIAAPNCQRATAHHAFYAPPSTSGMVGCMRDGMLYAAQSGLVDSASYAKVVCRYDDGIVRGISPGAVRSRL